MSDIVERLHMIRGTQFTPIEDALVTEAADTITALRAEVERLRYALDDTQSTLSAVKAEAIVDGGGTCLWIAEKLNQQMIDNRAALTQTKDTTDG